MTGSGGVGGSRDDARARGDEQAYILAVDDRPANLLALERVLASVPARIVRASSGQEALAAALRYRFALAILDVQMPEMDGYELAEILLNDPSIEPMPVIFVTAAYSDENHVFQGYQAGAVDYIVKPYNPSVLLAKVRVFLELARHRRELEGEVADRTTELAASHGRFDDLFRLAPEPLLMVDAAGLIVQANDAAGGLLGCRTGELVGKSVAEVVPAFDVLVQGVGEQTVELTTPPEGPGAVWSAVRSDGASLLVDVRLAKVNIGDAPHVFVSLHDVGERVAALEQTRRSLREKDTLLKEIHHRVKNNLQIVSSLLRLRCEQIDAADARAPLEESIGRVRSMALVHEQLYSHDSLDEIDLAEYVSGLGAILVGSYSPNTRLSVVAEPVRVSIEKAIPLALILHELVTNALKYGGGGASDGGHRRTGPDCDVLIEVTPEGDQVKVVVTDGGPGLPEQTPEGAAPTLGMQLVRSLARQLRGRLSFDSAGGLRVTLVCDIS